jgi:hypothetical protein
MRFLMIDGRGAADRSALDHAVKWLFAVIYPIKRIARERMGKNFVEPPVEGLWWALDMPHGAKRRRRSEGLAKGDAAYEESHSSRRGCHARQSGNTRTSEASVARLSGGQGLCRSADPKHGIQAGEMFLIEGDEITSMRLCDGGIDRVGAAQPMIGGECRGLRCQ